MKRGDSVLFTVALIYLFAKHSECFRWTLAQQSSHIINAQFGSDISLPCEFHLTSEEESAMQQFYLIYWSRETPAGSESWQGIAARSNLISNSMPTIIHRIKSRYAMTLDNSLTISNVALEDEGQYQCVFKSSFYTTPNLIKLKVTTTRQTNKEQKSPLSNGASAGIGVGITLIIVGFIAAVGILWLIMRKKKQVAEEATNGETTPRDDAAEAHVGPGYPGPDAASNEAVENQYSTIPMSVTKKQVQTTIC